MEFLSPIIAASERTGSRLSAMPSRRNNRNSVLSPNLHSMSNLTEDYLSQTVFDSDPTYTRVGFRRTEALDETRADFTNVTRKKKNEELMSILLEEDVPGIENAMELFEGFLKVFQAFGSEHQVFNQCAEYDAHCTEQVSSLRKLIQMAPQGLGKLHQAQELEQELRLERDTWRLVTSLYQDRLNSDIQDSEMEEEFWVSLEDATSEEDLVKQLYDKNPTIRQAQLVVDWLEQRASDIYHDSHYNQVEFYGDAVAGWENTLHCLNSQKRGLSSDIDQNLITEMDPDAPNRQSNKRLHPLDKEDEMRLLRSVFARLRSGQLEEAQQLCFRAGQPFRAAMLEGWKLFHDPNMRSSNKNDAKEAPCGNPYRDIWKSITWKECDNSRLSTEERSILALLSGNLKALLPSCQTWEDHLWAYLRVMIDQTVEKELRRCVNYKRQLQVLPDEYWNQQMTVDNIFSTLAASRDKTVSAQGRDQYRIIQRYIIMDDVDGLLEEMSSWLSKGEESLSWGVHLRPHMLRLMAHLGLFFRRIGRGSCDDLIGSILESYVQQLVHLSRTDLAAVYVGQLPLPADQVRLYAQCLVLVEQQSDSCDDAERGRLLSLAQQVGLDVNAIAKQVVITLCNQEDVQQVGDASLQIATTAEDERRIRSLSWLLLDSCMRSELLSQSNSLMRGYLLRRQIEAVKSTYQLIPPDTIALLSDQWESRTGLKELPPDVESSIREYLCVKTYLDALDSFQEWFSRFHHSQPKRSTVQQQRDTFRSGVSQMSFTENLLQEQHDKQHKVELQRWQAAVESLSQSAVDQLYNVLLFPDGGWMADHYEPHTTSRYNQMQLLRQTCIPHAALLLCNVLTNTGQYSRCLELANVMAAEHQALYQVCSAEQLSQLMKHFRQAYVKVLDKSDIP